MTQHERAEIRFACVTLYDITDIDTAILALTL